MLHFGLIAFPNLTQLDLTAPLEVFTRFPNSHVSIIAEKLEPITSEKGFKFLPDTTFETTKPVDVIFVPGGSGVDAAMENKKLISFLCNQACHAQYITSVCTGALILAHAGLLDGYKATSHWLSLDLLRLFPKVKVVAKRVVVDGNRITGGGVTAGIDMALVLAEKIYGLELAQSIQLMIEYNPKPPFKSGSPKTAPSKIVEKIKTERKAIQEKRRKLIEKLLNIPLV